MLNREKEPSFNTIDQISITEAKKEVLDNGISVYSIDTGSQELVRVEFFFRSGVKEQQLKLQASHTMNMMENGTKNYSAEEISEHLDFYGSYFQTISGFDHAVVALYSLNKHLKNSIGYVEEIIKNAAFSREEYEIFLENAKQRFLINSKKVSFISRNEFAPLIFGEEHPYNHKITLSDLNSMSREHLLDFYKANINYSNCTIIISGKLPEGYLSLLNQHFGKGEWGGKKDQFVNQKFQISSTKQNKHFIVKEDALQSNIRIGRILFNKLHPDFFKFQILNTVLGGYFGSRLMSNIREDKGYTYGIGSGLVSFYETGYFEISTEVGVEVTQNTLHEIYSEISRLQQELIPEDELELVKNYILGSFLRSVDGPFSLAEKFKSVWEYGLDYSYYNRYIESIKNCTSSELRALAVKYLQQNDLIELVVGKK